MKRNTLYPNDHQMIVTLVIDKKESNLDLIQEALSLYKEVEEFRKTSLDLSSIKSWTEL